MKVPGRLVADGAGAPELVHVLDMRGRQPRTLTSLSTALGWPAEHLVTVLRGRYLEPSSAP